jgi:hypothetical protein
MVERRAAQQVMIDGVPYVVVPVAALRKMGSKKLNAGDVLVRKKHFVANPAALAKRTIEEQAHLRGSVSAISEIWHLEREKAQRKTQNQPAIRRRGPGRGGRRTRR